MGKNIFKQIKNLYCFRAFTVFIATFFVINAISKEIVIEPGENAHERLQEAMILMEEGDILRIKSGYYSFEDGLSLDVDGVSVVGDGMEETILDFKDQKS